MTADVRTDTQRGLLMRLEKATLTPAKRAIRRWYRNRVPVKLTAFASYDAYRAEQNAGNRRKLALVAAQEPNIAYLARCAAARVGASPSGDGMRILCHGTRNGAEQRWFRNHLPEAAIVLGTEIADTATQFPDTVQWDFHEMKPEWAGAWDVIYSNSWDHAYDPERAFATWMACLSLKGILLLEHCHSHTPAHVTSLDPFGATLAGLTQMLDRIGAAAAPPRGVVEVIGDLPHAREGLRVVVVGAR